MYNSDYNRPPEEREPIETEHFHVWDAESPKPPRKKSGAARFVALGLCCALVGGLVGGGGVLAASHLSGGKTTIYQGTSPNSIVSLAHVDGQTVLSPEQIYAANLGATVGVNGNVDTNVFGYTVKNAVSGSGFVVLQCGYQCVRLYGEERRIRLRLRRSSMWIPMCSAIR